jgi:hypothetical protein
MNILVMLLLSRGQLGEEPAALEHAAAPAGRVSYSLPSGRSSLPWGSPLNLVVLLLGWVSMPSAKFAAVHTVATLATIISSFRVTRLMSRD